MLKRIVRFSIVSLVVSFLMFLPWFSISWSGEYPERDITVIVPYAPGATDREARLLAPVLAKVLGKSVLVDNKPGGGGSIGTNFVVRAKPDGYTLLFAAGTVLTLTPHASDLPYKIDDLIPLAGTSYISQLLAVGVNTPWKTIQEYVDYAKKNPRAIKFGSTGAGSAVHICGESLAAAAGVQLTHVPFKGVAEAITAVIGGHIDSVVAMPQPIIPQAKGEKIRPIVVFSSQRYAELPDVPAITESGIPFDTRAGMNWFGFFAPKGTPLAICNKFTEAVHKALTDQETLLSLKKIGSLPDFKDPKEFRSVLENQSNIFKDVLNSIGYKKN